MSAAQTTNNALRGLRKPWWKEYGLEIGIVVLGLIVMNLIFISKAFRESDTIDRAAASQLGDFVGGYVGTAFALVSVVLFLATLKNQRRTSQHQNFETKYFELIKMHRDNVAELDLQETSGRKIFVLLIREFREVLSVVRHIAQERQQTLTQQQLLHVSYNCLFFGTGPNSSRMLRMSLSKFDHEFVAQLDDCLSKKEIKERVRAERRFGYIPFEGHQSRLGHYYRHLYQTICYVDQQDLDIDKYEYVKTIRAQLTTHEQALLLLNSLAPIGQRWWHKGLIIRYRMVQNLPRDFFDSQNELDVSSLFPEGYFEWEEISEA